MALAGGTGNIAIAHSGAISLSALAGTATGINIINTVDNLGTIAVTAGAVTGITAAGNALTVNNGGNDARSRHRGLFLLALSAIPMDRHATKWANELSPWVY